MFKHNGQPLDLDAIHADLSICPHPEKKRYKTERQAEIWAERRGLNYYLCRCGLYHLTSRGIKPYCPLCGADLDEDGWGPDCGCFADIHYGK